MTAATTSFRDHNTMPDEHDPKALTLLPRALIKTPGLATYGTAIRDMLDDRPEVLDGFTCKVETPDGTMFVIINEQDRAPREIHIHVGKAGAPLLAWADALARVTSLALRSGLSVESILTEITGITSDRLKRLANGTSIRSGPDGVAYTLLAYKRERFARTQKESGLDDLGDGTLNSG